MLWGHVIWTFSHSKDNGKFQFLPCAAMRIVILEYCSCTFDDGLMCPWSDRTIVSIHQMCLFDVPETVNTMPPSEAILNDGIMM
jgi:hypothetical protein